MSARNSNSGSRAAARKKKSIGFEVILALVLCAIPLGWDMSGFPHSIVGACILWGASCALLAHAFWRYSSWRAPKKGLAIGVVIAIVVFLSYKPLINQYRIEHTATRTDAPRVPTGIRAQYTKDLQMSGVNSVGSEVGIDISDSEKPHLENVNTFVTDKEFQAWLDHLSRENADAIAGELERKQAALARDGKQIPPEVVQQIKALANNQAKLKAYLDGLEHK